MRKFFEGLSVIEMALFFLSLSFGIFLRFYNLDFQSPWTDELASWFYLRHLDQVFFFESHPPLYYGLLRVFLGPDASLVSIRYFSAIISSINLISIYFLAIRFLDKKKALMLFIVMCFNPADIVYARMARHYGILLEGVLIFVCLVRGQARLCWQWVMCFLMGLTHIFSLIPLSIILGFEFLKNKNYKTLLPVTGFLGVLVYYLARMATVGSKEVAKSVAWNNSSFLVFFKGTVAQFFGDAYPRNMFYETSWLFAVLIIGLCVVYLLIKKTRPSYIFITTWVASIIVIEVLNGMGINFRINRYVIYLCGLLPWAIIEALNSVKQWHVVATFIIMLNVMAYLNPLGAYPWDDEVIAKWKTYKNERSELKTFICANRYQASYYGLEAPQPCLNSVNQVNLKEDLIFFDLNNNDTLVALYLSQKMKPVDIVNFKHSRIIHFQPR